MTLVNRDTINLDAIAAARQSIRDYNEAWRIFGEGVQMGMEGEDVLSMQTMTPERHAAIAAIIREHCGLNKPYYKVLLAGRHSSEPNGGLPDNIYQVVQQENVTFSDDDGEVKYQLMTIAWTAMLGGMNAVVFQNTPVLVTGALMEMSHTLSDEWGNPFEPLHVGGIVSKQPASRPAGVTQSFELGAYSASGDGRFVGPNGIAEIVSFANPRAKVEVSWESDIMQETAHVNVTLDPVIPFEFVRVRWFYK